MDGSKSSVAKRLIKLTGLKGGGSVSSRWTDPEVITDGHKAAGDNVEESSNKDREE